MKGYGQFCPIAKAAEVLGERWTLLVVRELAAGSNSFNDLRKGVPLMSPSLLSTRLKTLVNRGIVEREEQGGHVSYKLTTAGEELAPVIFQLGTWGHRWVRSDLSDKDLDPSLLVWDIHRNLDAEYFTGERCIVKIVFSDYISKYRNWWLMIKDGDVDVCLKDPGHEVDLIMTSDLKSLTGVWMGDNTIMNAIREKKVMITGSSYLRKNIAVWFGANYYADIKPAI